MEKSFKSLNEVYNHVLPALRCKKNEIKLKYKYDFLEKDLFIYLKNTKWKNEKALTIADIVNDILNISDEEILNKLKN